MKTTYVHIRLNNDLKRAFENLTYTNYTTMTEVVTQGIVRWVREKEAEQYRLKSN